jgi:hypothetical protein
MSAISDLKDFFVTEAADISDSGDKLEALAAIDRWYNCRLAVDTLSTSDVASYSIGGRTVTRKSLPEMRNQEVVLLAEVKSWLGRGGGGLADNSENTGYYYS